jgi:hypothetical protein
LLIVAVYIDDGTAENCLCDALRIAAAGEVAGYDMSGDFYFDGDFECDIE